VARKANIAREEIHQACWELLETNSFPNIPRLTEYFLQKDGRRCSNTTFMNAIAEWEGAYKEHQEHHLKELDDVLLPVFKRFSRDITQNLGLLLDEKVSYIEQQKTLKQNAVKGGYLSLSSSLVDLQKNYDILFDEHENLKKQSFEFKQRQSFSQQKYQEILSQNQTLSSQVQQKLSENAELRISLSQKKADLDKLDNHIGLLKEENAKLMDQLKEKQNQQILSDSKKWQVISERLDAMTNSLKSMEHKG
jgi:predicted nuclease with TOPRIM domain